MTDATTTPTDKAGEPVGVAGAMPGTEGFTIAAFRSEDIPVGTSLYTHPQPSLSVGLDREAVARVEAFLNEWAKRSHKGDEICSLHTGNDREAALNASDLRAILALAARAEPLWMMHVRGPDDIFPAPDYETALAWSDYVNDVLAKAVPEVMTKAVPAIWTGTPEQHAEALPEAIKGWTLPAAPTGGRS